MPRGMQLVFCAAPTDKGLSCVRGPLYTRVTCADDQHGNRTVAIFVQVDSAGLELDCRCHGEGAEEEMQQAQVQE